MMGTLCRGSQRTPTNGKSLLGQPSGHTSGDATQPKSAVAGLTPSSLLLLGAVGAVILLQVSLILCALVTAMPCELIAWEAPSKGMALEVASGRKCQQQFMLVQVISLLRPARVQMGLVAPSAQHVTGLLQHVEQMLVTLKEMHQQLKQAHAMSS